jgi:hypothetical protein
MQETGKFYPKEIMYIEFSTYGAMAGRNKAKFPFSESHFFRFVFHGDFRLSEVLCTSLPTVLVILDDSILNCVAFNSAS